MIPSVQYPVLKVPACGDGPAARSSAFVLGARLNNTRTPGPCPELFRLRRYLHILHTYGVRRGLEGALRPPCSQKGFGRFAPFPACRRGAPGAGRRCAFHACDASIYIDATGCGALHVTGWGASRRGAGASCRGAWHHGKLRNAGRALESTGAARDGGWAATPSIAVRFASTHGDGHLLIFVLDLMLLGRCSVDDLSLALGSHARLS